VIACKTSALAGLSANPGYIRRPKFGVPAPNKVHQAYFLFLPHNTVGQGRGRKAYKYALTVIDVAIHYKEA